MFMYMDTIHDREINFKIRRFGISLAFSFMTWIEEARENIATPCQTNKYDLQLGDEMGEDMTFLDDTVYQI
jgi:hypothetical protein